MDKLNTLAVCILKIYSYATFQDQSLTGFEPGQETEMIIEGEINSSSGSVIGEKEKKIPAQPRGRPRKIRSEGSTASKENQPPRTVILYNFNGLTVVVSLICLYTIFRIKV